MKTSSTAAAHKADLALAKTLPERLKRAMTLRGTNPNRVEVSTGITRQTLYAVLRGNTKNFSWPLLVKVSNHLGIRPEWLAEGKLPMFPPPTLDDSEIQLIQDFREMSEGHQKDLSDIARRWADEDGPPSRGNPFRRVPPTHQ
jgi:transcriptional regulator with XRE-family HTH domain